VNTYQVQLKRVVPCAPERAFELWTDPSLVAKWFGPPNGRMTLDMNAQTNGTYRFDVVMDDGLFFGCSGAYTHFERPHHLAFTWQWDESSFDSGVSEVDIQFLPVESGTELILTHKKLAGDISEQRHTQGWLACLDRLEALFS